MKKYLITFLIVYMCFLFSGCDLQQMQQESQEFRQEQKEQKIEDSVYIYTDPETGVQYLCFYCQQGYAGMGGITPRLNSDGSLIVIDNDNEE